MSDFFEGPGHWMASDGKWYPPERHPDPEYRARFASTPPPVPETAPRAPERAGNGEQMASTADTLSADTLSSDSIDHEAIDHEAAEPESVTEEVVSKGEFPSVGISRDAQADAHHQLTDLHRSSADAPTTPKFSVASTDFAAAPERPVFDDPIVPPSVSHGPNTRAATVSTEAAERRSRATEGSGIRLELGNDPAKDASYGGNGAQSTKLSTSTALAVIPSATIETRSVASVDRILAAIIFCAGVAMIVGTFLDWTTGSLMQTGWDRGDGVASIIAGVLGSACAGPIYVGYRHLVPKAVAIVCGLAGLVVVGLTASSVLLDSETAATSLGNGAIAVAAGALVMTLAGVAHRIDPYY